MDIRNKDNEYRAIVERAPNGWPSVGDFVDDDDIGFMFRVVQRGESIWPGVNGREDYIHVVVEMVDRNAIPEGADIWAARIHIGDLDRGGR